MVLHRVNLQLDMDNLQLHMDKHPRGHHSILHTNNSLSTLHTQTTKGIQDILLAIHLTSLDKIINLLPSIQMCIQSGNTSATTYFQICLCSCKKYDKHMLHLV